MKTRLIALLAGAAFVVFATVALADGKNCDSKKGHGGKDMSAEMMKEFKKHHGWYSEDSAKQDKMAEPKDTAVKI